LRARQGAIFKDPYIIPLLINIGLTGACALAIWFLGIVPKPPVWIPSARYVGDPDPTRAARLSDIILTATLWLAVVVGTSLWHLWAMRARRGLSVTKSARSALIASVTMPFAPVLIRFGFHGPLDVETRDLVFLGEFAAAAILALSIIFLLCAAIAPRSVVLYVVVGTALAAILSYVFFAFLMFGAFCC